MKLKDRIRNASPTILSILAALGVVATAVSTKKATENIVKDKECNLNFEEEKNKLYFKHYLVPVLIGAGTIMCIFGSNKLSKSNQALLTSAYALLDQTHKEYINKVKQLKGEETHREIIDSIALDHCDSPMLTSSSIVGDSSLDVDSKEIVHTFYDSFSKRYFESTMSRVLQAEYHLNRNYMLGAEVNLATWYEFLGLDNIDFGEEFTWWFMNYAGWQMQDGIYWIDFDHHIMKTKSGKEIIVIDFVWEPSMEPEPELPF